MNPRGGRLRVLVALSVCGATVVALAVAVPFATAAPRDPTVVPPADDPQLIVVTGPQYLVSPGSAKPGEVVHVRFPNIQRLAGGYVVAWLHDLGFSAPLTVTNPKFGATADLPVPPGAPRGPYPIVVLGPGQTTGAALLKRSVVTIPFIVTRSEGPPTWSR